MLNTNLNRNRVQLIESDPDERLHENLQRERWDSDSDFVGSDDGDGSHYLEPGFKGYD